MPRIKSAKKKLRADSKRTKSNLRYINTYKKILKDIRKNRREGKKVKAEIVKKAYSAIDKSAKKGIIHKNKAARLKSKVAKLQL